MKMLDRIIADIHPLDMDGQDIDEFDYFADTRVILENLRDYEIDVPQEYRDAYKGETGGGVEEYMIDISGVDSEIYPKINDWHGFYDNTFNYNGSIVNDLRFICIETANDFYIAISAGKNGDIRSEKNYTPYALFRFDSKEDFVDIVDTICTEQMGGSFEYDGKRYYYDFSIFEEEVRVWLDDEQQDIDIDTLKLMRKKAAV